MYCPACEERRPAEDSECRICGGALAQEPPGFEPDPTVALVKVFEADQPGLLALATMALDEADIEYLVRNVREPDVITGGGIRRVSTDLGLVKRVFVRGDDEARARDRLADLQQADAAALDPGLDWMNDPGPESSRKPGPRD